MAKAWIGIGSNLGDRESHIRKGVALMNALPDTVVVAVSSIYDTAPVGSIDQPRFLNAAAELETELTARSLLGELMSIEEECGRIRGDRWGPRTLDLDLLLFDELQLSGEDLTLPHPRMAERAFVLVPLAEIAPDLFVPGTGRVVSELLHSLQAPGSAVTRVCRPPTVD